MAERLVLDGSSGKTKAEQAHVSDVVELGCLVCRLHFGLESPAEVAHLNGVGASRKSSWFEVYPLCPRHHRLVGVWVAYHNSPELFVECFGREAELLAAVEYLLEGVSDGAVRDKFGWTLQPQGSVHSPRPLSETSEGAASGSEHDEGSTLQARRGRDWDYIADRIRGSETGESQ